MAQYRVNKPVAAAYALAAALATGGGGYYYTANVDEWRRESAEKAAGQIIRDDIAAILPLAYEMTALAPGAPYPAAPEIAVWPGMSPATRPVSMQEAFAEAETDLRAETLENSYRSCAILAYIREAHSVAVRHYQPDAAQPAPVDLERHRNAAAANHPPCKP